MLERFKKSVPIILFCVAIIVITPAISIITRSAELHFDPVLLIWSMLLGIFTYNHYRTISSVNIIAIPVLLLSLLPVLGFTELQNNPNNENLLNVKYYQFLLAYLIASFTMLSKFQKKND
jgi:uncharacterized membrane protein YoaK (UPF0700 family)